MAPSLESDFAAETSEPARRRSRLRPRLCRRLARTSGRPWCDGRCRCGGDVRDPANDVRAGDVDLRAISVGSGTAPGRAVHGAREDHRQRRATPQASGQATGRGRSSRGEAPESTPSCSTTSRSGGQQPSPERSRGATATVRAPIEALGGQTNATLGRVSAYFRAEPVAGRLGDADRAANVGPTVWFCLTDRRPRPKWGPCIWPGQVALAQTCAESPTARRDPARPRR